MSDIAPVSVSPTIAQQAATLRSIDQVLHPLIVAGLGMIPGIGAPAVAVDAWVYDLFQKPGILESVLEILPFEPKS